LPDSADAALVEMIDAIEPQITDALAVLEEEYADAIEHITSEMQPCDHCRNQKYETYVLLTVLRRAFVRAHCEP
jgi:cytidine deaminase